MSKRALEKAPAANTLKNDVILVLALLLFAVLLGLGLLWTQKSGDVVCVRVNGEEYGTYSLHKDAVVEIVTEEGYNRLVIRDGKAFVEAADCPDGICAAHRPIDGTRESITCLPHGVVISVSRSTKQNTPDVILGKGSVR